MSKVRFLGECPNLMVHKDEVHQHPENANNGDVEEIMASILKDGCYRPSYASSRTGNILAGNNLYEALIALGQTRVPVSWIDCDYETELRILFKDNAIARRAKTDDAQLLELLEKIAEEDPDLVGVGADQRDLENLRALVEKEQKEPLDLGLQRGSEKMINVIRCPECGHEWNRGSV